MRRCNCACQLGKGFTATARLLLLAMMIVLLLVPQHLLLFVIDDVPVGFITAVIVVDVNNEVDGAFTSTALTNTADYASSDGCDLCHITPYLTVPFLSVRMSEFNF